MTKNPFLNALAAAVYIVLIVFVLNTFVDKEIPNTTLLVPMVMLSLFVLSVAVMGFLFIYEPLQLYSDNKRQEAISFFAKTVGIFACFAALFLALLLYTAIL